MPLEEAFAIYEDYRAAMMAFLDTVPDYLNTITPKVRHLILKAAWFMDKKVYTEKIRALTAGPGRPSPRKSFPGRSSWSPASCWTPCRCWTCWRN